MAKACEIGLQPKQAELERAIRDDRAVVIGVGGGRGSAKSSGADRIVIGEMYRRRMHACMVMRNWDQIKKYHIEPISTDFPWLRSSLRNSIPAKLTITTPKWVSDLDFSYAENYDDVVRRFQSGNYDLIVIDQAEQFSEREIREIRRANRSRGGKPAKMVLLFNMRGSGIQSLRKWFYLGEFNKDEDPEDYKFIKFNPWDNIEWVRDQLDRDGYTEYDYYAWTDEQRKSYAAEKGAIHPAVGD